MKASALRAAPPERRIEWLAAAAEKLLADSLDARDALSESTGLSAPMVDWAARTTLETFTPQALRALLDEAGQEGRVPVDSLAVVLAGNVFTAVARAVMVPALLGIPVWMKASSRETTFPRLLCDALRGCDEELGDAIVLRAFAGGDLEAEAALISGAEVTTVYGSDETVRAIHGRHPDAPLIAHGHGVSVAFCALPSMDARALSRAAAGLALDVCAYDQRGCLSPQVIYVTEEEEHSASSFARALTAEIRTLSLRLPRGPLPLEVGAAQAQWRGLAEVEGELLTGDDHAIAVRPSLPLRWSPGYRNVTVAAVKTVEHAINELRALGEHLKCVGADQDSVAAVRTQLDEAPELSAYVCALGTMQTPLLGAPVDGHPIWHGLLR